MEYSLYSVIISAAYIISKAKLAHLLGYTAVTNIFSLMFPLCSLLGYTEQYVEYDPFLTLPDPSNPWISDDTTVWELEARFVAAKMAEYKIINSYIPLIRLTT